MNVYERLKARPDTVATAEHEPRAGAPAAPAIPFEWVSRADARRFLDGPPARGSANVLRYTATHRETLEPATLAWMEALPDLVKPLLLARRFPRVTNNICALWGQPVACAEYLADLLIVRDGVRQGFPVPVATDIFQLSAYYDWVKGSAP